MNEKTPIYVVVMIEALGSGGGTTKTSSMPYSYNIEPLGVYSDIELALDYVEKLEDGMPSKKGKTECIFDILEYYLDEKPILLEFMEKDQKRRIQVEDSLTESLVDLMKKGLVDQLVGEDGNFYYVLTDLGKETVKSMPEQIKKYFRRKK